MITQIFLQLEDVSGIQLRVVNTLKKHGLRTVKHVLREAPNGGKLLAMEVEGDEAIGEGEVKQVVNGIDGVRSSLKISRVVPAAAPELTDDEKRYKSFESEAGDLEIRDRMLIFSLLSRYPNISNRLIELKGSIPAEDQPDRLYQLGRGFGLHLVANLKARESIFDLETALEKVIAPGLRPLADLDVLGDVIAVDGYTKNLDRGKPDGLLCQFVHGAIEGLLKGTPDLPPFRVEKKHCLHRGAARCDFHVVPA